jgi:hypothetical protein
VAVRTNFKNGIRSGTRLSQHCMKGSQCSILHALYQTLADAYGVMMQPHLLSITGMLLCCKARSLHATPMVAHLQLIDKLPICEHLPEGSQVYRFAHSHSHTEARQDEWETRGRHKQTATGRVYGHKKKTKSGTTPYPNGAYRLPESSRGEATLEQRRQRKMYRAGMTL